MQDERSLVLAAAKQISAARYNDYSWSHCQFLPLNSENLRSDRDTMLAIVAIDGLALKSASTELRADDEVVKTAIAQDCGALEYADERFKGDHDTVLRVVEAGCSVKYSK